MPLHRRSAAIIQRRRMHSSGLLGLLALAWSALCPLVSSADTRADHGVLIRQGDMCLDINAPQARTLAQTDGARVQLRHCDGRPGQVWRIEGDRIRQSGNDYCLEVHAPDIGADGARVQVAACRSSDAQMWRNERGRFVNRSDRRCLTVFGLDADRDGARVENFGCAGDRVVEARTRNEGAQLWSIEPVAPRPLPRALTQDVEAGPLWNDTDAARKCPQVCAPERWSGAWRTTIQGRMSVCGCEIAPPVLRDQRYDDEHDHRRDEHRERPMTDEAFSTLLDAMSRASFSDEKLRVLEVAAELNRFRIAQVRRVIDTLPFASDRTRVVDILAPRVLDPENAYTLLDAFTFDSEKAHVRDAFKDAHH